jgi:hypothetical protein
LAGAAGGRLTDADLENAAGGLTQRADTELIITMRADVSTLGTSVARRGPRAYCPDPPWDEGELLALVDGAPGRLRTLQAALTTWTHRGRIAEVHRRTDQEHVPSPATMSSSISSATTG